MVAMMVTYTQGKCLEDYCHHMKYLLVCKKSLSMTVNTNKSGTRVLQCMESHCNNSVSLVR
jgi:hypothetical protein